MVIPREILETLNRRAGDLVAFAQQKNGVLIKPERAVPSGDTLSPEEAKIVRCGGHRSSAVSRNPGGLSSMLFRVEASREAERQLSKFPRKVRDRIERAIGNLEERDDSQWSSKAIPGTRVEGEAPQESRRL